MARKPGQLTPKQERFVQEYMIDLNATQAAIRAGYAESSAEQQGCVLLRNPKVKAVLDAKQAKKADKLDITAERVLREYARIAFADIRSIASVDDLTWIDEKLSAKGISIKSSDTWGDDVAAAVSEISSTQHGPKVKLHDKQHALDALSKHLGLFKADHDQSKTDVYVEAPVEAIAMRVATLLKKGANT